MKVIIIGAQGMLGHALSDVFSRATQKLLLWDRGDLDIVNRAAVEMAIGREKPDILINAAAYTDVDGAEKERERAMQVNATGVGNLADTCAKLQITMVHYSTDYVFDGKNPNGYKESDVAGNPVNFYGRSKLAGEELFVSPFKPLNLEHGIYRWYLVRTSWLYGPHGKNFPLSMIERVRGGQKEFKVVNDQHGRPTYTYDLAHGTFELLKSKSPAGIYHLTNSVKDNTSGQKEPSVTWFDFTTEIFHRAVAFDPAFHEVSVGPCTSVDFPRPAIRPNYSILVSTKRPPLRLWEDALQDYLRSH